MVDKIEYGDTGKQAREKINGIIEFAEDNIPSIGENGDRYLGNKDTEVPATGPQGEQGPQGPEGPQGENGEDISIVSKREYDDTPGTGSDDISYFIWH